MKQKWSDLNMFPCMEGFTDISNSIYILGWTSMPSTGQDQKQTKKNRCNSKFCRIYYNSTIINKKQQLQKYVQVYYSFKILVTGFRYQFQLGPMFSLCNAASSAVLSPQAFVFQLDATKIYSPPKPLNGHRSCEQILLKRVKTSTTWRMAVMLLSTDSHQ